MKSKPKSQKRTAKKTKVAAAQIAVSAEGWTATVRNGRLCLVNPAPAGFTVLIR